MKNYEEMSQSVLRRRDAYLQRKIRRQKIMMRVGIPTVCICCIAGLSFMIHSSGVWRNPEPIDIVSSSPLSSLAESDKGVSSDIASQASHTVSENESFNKQKDSSIPTSSIISHSKDNSSKTSSSTVTSSENNAQFFKSIEAFQKYVKKLYSSTLKNHDHQSNNQQASYSPGPSSVASSGSTADSSETSSVKSSAPSSPVVNNPGCDLPTYYPDASISSSVPIIKDDVINSIDNMVDNGWFAFPKLGNGNQTLRLLKVKVNDDGIYYQYRFKDKVKQSQSSYDLMIALLPDDSSIQSEYQWVLQNGRYDAYTHDSVTFTVCHPLSSDSNTRFIYWKQFGQYYVAYYQGDYAYLPDILPELTLQIIYLDE